MKPYEKLYVLKNNPKFVKEYLGEMLLFQIYSPEVIRECYPSWPIIHSFLRENTPPEIVDLIEKSAHWSNKNIQKRLNQYQIEKAIGVLKSYQNCAVPLTKDPSVKQTRRKLTSSIGDRNLKILEQAQQNGIYSDKMADLAVRCSHKFLFDDKNYRSWKIPSKLAQALTQPQGDGNFTFPSIQLTKGCENHCSHCCDRAENHLSHMPWPVFVNLYRGLHKHYQHYPQKQCDCYFARFFADSDSLSYYDNIMGTDAGDMGLWVHDEDGVCQYLTRGIRGKRSKLALEKAIVSRQPIAISFVDTPKENMPQNIQQLSDTLDVFEEFPNRQYNPSILHLHMKSGSTVSDEIFRNFPVEKKGIWAMGRGKDLPFDETEHYPDNQFWVPDVISPNGDVLMCQIKDGENVKKKVTSLYGVYALSKKIPCWKKVARLFKRQR